jgi:Ring finger domain
MERPSTSAQLALANVQPPHLLQAKHAAARKSMHLRHNIHTAQPFLLSLASFVLFLLPPRAALAQPTSSPTPPEPPVVLAFLGGAFLVISIALFACLIGFWQHNSPRACARRGPSGMETRPAIREPAMDTLPSKPSKSSTPREFLIDAARRYDPCPICLEELHTGPAAQGRCLHAAHAACLAIWLAKGRSCPICRKRFRDGAPVDGARELTAQVALGAAPETEKDEMLGISIQGAVGVCPPH